MQQLDVSAYDVPDAQIAAMAERLDAIERQLERAPRGNAIAMVIFSGDLDRLLAAFSIANGAAACGMKVSMFFTFWGTAALKQRTLTSGKSVVEKAFGMLLPAGLQRRALSRLDMAGLGRRLIKREMSRKNIAGIDELLEQAATLGVSIKICQMSMELMGITEDELIDFPDIQYCGAATFLALARESNTSLFV